MDRYVHAFAEGLDTVHPLTLAWPAWISQAERRYPEGSIALPPDRQRNSQRNKLVIALPVRYDLAMR